VPEKVKTLLQTSHILAPCLIVKCHVTIAANDTVLLQ